MDIKELKIGNYYYYGDNIVSTIHKHDFLKIEEEPEFYKPVSLTEEWLLNMGFTYNDLNGDTGHWQLPFFQILEGEEGFSYDYRLEIKFVHQLQNLYFALTGEELTIKEEPSTFNKSLKTALEYNPKDKS